jgi:hypothetical protein
VAMAREMFGLFADLFRSIDLGGAHGQA